MTRGHEGMESEDAQARRSKCALDFDPVLAQRGDKVGDYGLC